MTTTQQAINYVNANLTAIANAALTGNEAALDVQTCYVMLCQYRNVVSEEELVNAVALWQDYCADNPTADV
jgi:hypothetical protein